MKLEEEFGKYFYIKCETMDEVKVLLSILNFLGFKSFDEGLVKRYPYLKRKFDCSTWDGGTVFLIKCLSYIYLELDKDIDARLKEDLLTVKDFLSRLGYIADVEGIDMSEFRKLLEVVM